MKFFLFFGLVLALAACQPLQSNTPQSDLLDELTKEPDAGEVDSPSSQDSLEENASEAYEFHPTLSPEIKE